MILLDCNFSAPIYEISEKRSELAKFTGIEFSGISLVGSGFSSITRIKLETEEQAALFLLEYGTEFQARRSPSLEFTAGIRNMYIGG